MVVGWGLMSVGRSLLLVLQPLPPQHGYPFLCSLGEIFLVPNPVSGALVALAIALGSPYLLLLCALSFALSYALLAMLGVPLDSYAQVLAGTEAMLSCLMIGGLWLSPGRASLVLGLVAAAASSLTYLACTSLLAPLGLPPLALPIVLVTWLGLWVFWPRASGFWRFQRLLAPALPERSWERCSQAQARGLDPAAWLCACPSVECGAATRDLMVPTPTRSSGATLWTLCSSATEKVMPGRACSLPTTTAGERKSWHPWPDACSTV